MSDDKENFAYIMKLCAKSEEEMLWKGWGAHIAADWVAHDKKFLSLPYKELLEDKEKGKKIQQYHRKIEREMDFYIYLTQGNLPDTKIKVNPELIYKTLVNKRLIELKRKHSDWKDEKLKNEALKDVNSRCSLDFIKQAAGWWSMFVAVVRVVYPMRKIITNEEKFMQKWTTDNDGKVALDNYEEAKDSVSNWLNWAFGYPTGWATKEVPPLNVTPRPGYQDVAQKTVLREDDTKIWLEVANKAEKEGVLQKVVVADEPDNYEIYTQCNNEARLNQIIKEVINYHKNYPTSDDDLVLAQEMEIAFIKGMNYDTLDYIPPTITDLTPAEEEVITETPTISASITDDNSGVDTTQITLKLDNQIVTPTYNEATNKITYTPPAPLFSGKHTIFLQAFDKAGNPSYPKRGTFTIDTRPPTITNPQATPDTVGPGEVVKFTVKVTDIENREELYKTVNHKS